MKRYTVLVWVIKFLRRWLAWLILVTTLVGLLMALHDGFKYLQLQRVSKFAC